MLVSIYIFILIVYTSHSLFSFLFSNILEKYAEYTPITTPSLIIIALPNGTSEFAAAGPVGCNN